MPPVVDPVHYGIHTAEPLWPIRRSKLPPFRLPPEAMLAAASTDRHWRPRPASRPKETDVTLLRTLNQPSQQRSDQPSSSNLRPAVVQSQHKQQHKQPQQHHHHLHDSQRSKAQYHRHPVKSTAWKGYDRSTNRPIGRSPAVVPSLLTSARAEHRQEKEQQPQERRNQQSWAEFQVTGRQNTYTESRASVASNRFFVGSSGASSGRSFGNSQHGIDGQRRSSSVNTAGTATSYINHSSKITDDDVVDRSDNSPPLWLDDGKTVGHERNDTLNENDKLPTHHQRKRARKQFSPLQFVIQQGHSRVRKYGV